jgi:catechol 2,3-dioxygenase-like lactoylglutathione lyase family enzyme
VASRLATITIDCADPAKLAAFWTEVFGCDERAEEDGGVYVAKSDGSIDLFFQPVPEHKVVKNRLHLDVIPPSTMQEEVDRLAALGATVQRLVNAHNSYWTVMLDPEGNEFCVLRGDAERAASTS